MEMSAHDALRYANDMLAWIHHALLAEHELVEALLPAEENRRLGDDVAAEAVAVNAADGPSSTGDTAAADIMHPLDDDDAPSSVADRRARILHELAEAVREPFRLRYEYALSQQTPGPAELRRRPCRVADDAAGAAPPGPGGDVGVVAWPHRHVDGDRFAGAQGSGTTHTAHPDAVPAGTSADGTGGEYDSAPGTAAAGRRSAAGRAAAATGAECGRRNAPTGGSGSSGVSPELLRGGAMGGTPGAPGGAPPACPQPSAAIRGGDRADAGALRDGRRGDTRDRYRVVRGTVNAASAARPRRHCFRRGIAGILCDRVHRGRCAHPDAAPVAANRQPSATRCGANAHLHPSRRRLPAGARLGHPSPGYRS
eukprot:ctg_299.g161